MDEQTGPVGPSAIGDHLRQGLDQRARGLDRPSLERLRAARHQALGQLGQPVWRRWLEPLLRPAPFWVMATLLLLAWVPLRELSAPVQPEMFQTEAELLLAEPAGDYLEELELGCWLDSLADNRL